jgi:hypothetical protein
MNMTTQREAFELWAQPRGYMLEKIDDNQASYEFSDTYYAWEGYKAALSQPNEPVTMVIDSVASGIINGKRQALPMGSVYYLSPPSTSELEAKVKRLGDKLDKADDYIKRMDRVIDNKGITRSCINPLVDLTNSVDYMVAKIAELEQANTVLEGKLEKMREALEGTVLALKGYRKHLNDDQPCDHEQSAVKALKECK